MLKKTLSLLSLMYGGLAVSGTMGPVCTPGSVTVPCEANAWELGVQALYLKPSYNQPLGTPPVTTSIQPVQSEWDWGYRLDGAYHFNTGNDITVNWTHYDASSAPGTFSGQYLQLLPQGAGLLVTRPYGLSLDNKYDQVNLVLGQHVDFGMRKDVRFYGGLQYAKIRVDGTSVFTPGSLFLPITGGNVTDFINTDFNGIGPVLGLDYSYDLISGFSVTANAATSLLYGTARYNFATVYQNGLVVASVYGGRKILVPGMEAKLGVNYACESSYGQINLEGGYQAVNYFNALQVKPTTTGGLINSNFGLYGPYFGLKWLGNA